MNFRKLTAAVLTAALVLSVIFAAVPVSAERTVDGFTFELAGTHRSRGDLLAAPTVFDGDSVLALCDALCTAAEEGDCAAVRQGYDDILAAFGTLFDTDVLCMLDYYDDPDGAGLSEDYLNCESLCAEVRQQILAAFRTVTRSACAEDFRDYVGEEYFSAYASFAKEGESDEEADLSEREDELLVEYYAAVDKYSCGRISYSKFHKTVGNIFLELVQVRTQQAQAAGYADYAEYADQVIYGRTYSSGDAAALCQTVREVGPAYFSLVYNEAYQDRVTTLIGGPTADTLALTIAEYAGRVGALPTEAAEFLTEHTLYDIASDTGRISSSFCAVLTGTGVPYIYLSGSGNTGLISLSHEFGHFCYYYANPVENPLFFGLNQLDLLEIHSTGFQALFTRACLDTAGDEADLLRAFELTDLLSSLVTGCLFDEFQRTVYQNPDMTLEEIDALYQRLCEEYGDPYTGPEDYFWCMISHNFENPMYYLSYAVSAAGGIELWAAEDQTAAAESWQRLVENFSVYDSYEDQMLAAGLSPFTDTEAVLRSSREVVSEINACLLSLGLLSEEAG